MSGTRSQRLLRQEPFPVPEGTQRIGKVIDTPGSNTIMVHLAGVPDGQPPMQTRLPSKFKNTVWFRRDDFVIADYERGAEGEGAQPGPDTIGWVVHKLDKPQIKFLRGSGKWPAEFDEREAGSDDGQGDDDEYLVNRNHRTVDDSEEEEEEEGSAGDDLAGQSEGASDGDASEAEGERKANS
jgi:hypothetical protein